MSPAVVLFILRIISAVLLLFFFGLIAWLIYRDIKMATEEIRSPEEILGRLLVVSDDEKPAGVRHYPLHRVTRIGRSANNTVVIDDAFASNEHALLVHSRGQWWLEDLDSRNGTLLNDIALESPAVVSAGDIITIGRTSLELQLEASE